MGVLRLVWMEGRVRTLIVSASLALMLSVVLVLFLGAIASVVVGE